jgi:hypothetical protein
MTLTSEQVIWLMDSEYCCECGTALSRHESTLCYDCQQDEWYDEDQDFYDDWMYMSEEEEGQP